MNNLRYLQNLNSTEENSHSDDYYSDDDLFGSGLSAYYLGLIGCAAFGLALGAQYLCKKYYSGAEIHSEL